MSGRLVQRLCARGSFRQRRHYLGTVIGREECRRARRRRRKIVPAPFVAKLAVQGFPSFRFLLGVQQRVLRPFHHRNVGAACNFQQAQGVLGFFLHPLVAADGGDAQHLEFSDCGKTRMDCRSVVAGPRASWSTMTLIFSACRLLVSSSRNTLAVVMEYRSFIVDMLPSLAQLNYARLAAQPIALKAWLRSPLARTKIIALSPPLLLVLCVVSGSAQTARDCFAFSWHSLVSSLPFFRIRLKPNLQTHHPPARCRYRSATRKAGRSWAPPST